MKIWSDLPISIRVAVIWLCILLAIFTYFAPAVVVSLAILVFTAWSITNIVSFIDKEK